MKEGKKQNKQGIYLFFKKKKRLIYLVVKLQITYMGVEEDLLLEEAEEGHLEQLNRCETAYNTKNASATALFEYGWVLTRDEDVDKVNEGIKILKYKGETHKIILSELFLKLLLINLSKYSLS